MRAPKWTPVSSTPARALDARPASWHCWGMESESYPIPRRADPQRGSAPFRRGLPYGSVPMGYVAVQKHGRTRVAIDHYTAPLIREAFHWAAEGKLPLRKVLEKLVMRGMAARRGKPMRASSFYKLLTDPFYCGMVRFNGMLLEGLHEPLVDRATFDRVQRTLYGKRRRK